MLLFLFHKSCWKRLFPAPMEDPLEMLIELHTPEQKLMKLKYYCNFGSNIIASRCVLPQLRNIRPLREENLKEKFQDTKL